VPTAGERVEGVVASGSVNAEIQQVNDLGSSTYQLVIKDKAGDKDFTDATALRKQGAPADWLGTLEDQEENPYVKNIIFEGNHIEQDGSSPGTGCEVLRIEDPLKKGKTIPGVRIANNSFGNNQNNCRGVYLDRVRSVAFIANSFHITSAGTGRKTIEITSSCKGIDLGWSNFMNSASVDYACDREEIHVGTWVLNDSNTISGFNGNTFGNTPSGQLIDMSSALGTYPDFGGLPPRAYAIGVVAQDTGSSGDTVYIALSRASSINLNYAERLDLSGVVDSKKRGGSFIVPADSNGDIYARWHASGDDELTIWMTVDAIFM
jgi:hypothetical protein